jgi:aminoglycoside phosphotransferase (APT) family kinase protein
VTELSSELTTWIESSAGGTITSVKQIPAGGRQGFFVDALGHDGEVRELFLQRGRDAADAAAFHGFAIEAEVFGALARIGIPVPRVWALSREHDALLLDRVPGGVWFTQPRDPAEAEAVAKDFMATLARIHGTPAEQLDLPSLGPVKSWREHQLDQLDGVAQLMKQSDTGDGFDPLVTFTYEWLRSNIPAAEGQVVLVQGDTGPGNFLYQHGKVTGVIDWELAHLGDPMDDLAWLSWRATQHGFPDFPARLREYEHLTGFEVDDARVHYYRLNAFGRLGPYFALADMGRRTRQPSQAVDIDNDRSVDGSWVIMSMLHRRMRLEATAAALGTPIPPRELEEAELPAHSRQYDRVLRQLSTLVERLDDRTSAGIAKAVARDVKHLKELDRNGAFFAEQELAQIGALLGAVQPDLAHARPALVQAVEDGRVPIEAYLDYHWNRLRRDDHLMRFASGALYERSWPALRAPV